MIMIETRQAAKDKAFDLLEEIEDLGYQKKMAFCKLKETLYECFESLDDEEDEDEYESSEYIPNDDEDKDIDYKYGKSYRYRSAMRKAMRDAADDANMKDSYNARRQMRMRRRNRMGKFV